MRHEHSRPALNYNANFGLLECFRRLILVTSVYSQALPLDLCASAVLLEPATMRLQRQICL